MKSHEHMGFSLVSDIRVFLLIRVGNREWVDCSHSVLLSALHIIPRSHSYFSYIDGVAGDLFLAVSRIALLSVSLGYSALNKDENLRVLRVGIQGSARLAFASDMRFGKSLSTNFYMLHNFPALICFCSCTFC